MKATTAEKVVQACRAARAEFPVRIVTDGVARAIATQWNDGPTTALYALAACGAIHDQEQLLDEIERELTRQKAAEHVDEDAVDVLQCLEDYVIQAEERPDVEGWSEQWVK